MGPIFLNDLHGIKEVGADHGIGSHHGQGTVGNPIIDQGDGAQLLPGGDRGLNALGQVDDQFGLGGVVVGGHGCLDGAHGLGQHEVRLVGQGDGHLSDHILGVLVQQGGALEVVKAPFQQA